MFARSFEVQEQGRQLHSINTINSFFLTEHFTCPISVCR
nr:MAG TPA: hypothetical protein [Caudoviricetes sp.]